jgi:hypothetical protein
MNNFDQIGRKLATRRTNFPGRVANWYGSVLQAILCDLLGQHGIAQATSASSTKLTPGGLFRRFLHMNAGKWNKNTRSKYVTIVAYNQVAGCRCH